MLPIGLSAKPSDTKPNIILFVGDDHSVWDLGCYGNKVVRTPNLDRLAKQGMRFDRAFTVTAMCAPARSMLYTGLYPHQNGCHMNHGMTRKAVKSLPHYLKPQGYRVVLAGKTHIKPKKVYPFEYMGMAGAGKVIQGEQPFCLVIASHDPHSPHKSGGYQPKEVPVPAYFPDLPAVRRGIADYYTDIDTLDQEIGNVMKLLKNSGKESNTLFVYAGDHGYGFMAKWTCYEAGLRVPFIVSWPGQIKAGSKSDAMVSFIDVLPTFLDAAGTKQPDGIDGKSFIKVLRGENHHHRKLIFGAHTNQGIILGEPYPIRSVRDERYKYIRNLNPNGRQTNLGLYKNKNKDLESALMTQWKAKAKTDAKVAHLLSRVINRPAEELYDLREDPWELHNLAAEESHQKTKTRLSKELDAWMQQQNDKGMESELSVKKHKTMLEK